jgi:serine/threonine protein kinase
MADQLEQLGNYRLICLLGEGGFANVYLGEHIYLNTQAAIKVLQMHLGKEELEDFLNEARTIARLVHPHIIRVLEFGVEDNTPFLVMDYAPNGTLRHRHPKGTRLPLDTVTDYASQVAAALQYAHDRKLIHRDVKPENMLLSANNDILLSDFGIALVAQTSRSLQPNIQEAAGTLAYMAPEQLGGKPRPASDQYALGIVVYEWLTGERPFYGTFTEVASQHMFIPPVPLHEKFSDILPSVEQAVMKALAKDPHQRYDSVQEFATALEQASSHEPLLPIMPSLEPRPSQSNHEGSSLHQLHTMPTTLKLPSQVPASENDHDPRPTPVLPIPALLPVSQVSQPSVSDTATLQLTQTPLPHPIIPASEPSLQGGGKLTPLQVPPQRNANAATRAISRRAMIVGIAGLASLTVVGSSIAFLAEHFHTPSHSHVFRPTATSAQTTIANPTDTSTVQPGQTQTATPVETPTTSPTPQPTATPSPTPNPTPTATQTPSPTPTSTSVSTISAGTAPLQGTHSFDFDQGLEVSNGGDVYWDVQNDPIRTLDPVGNAQLANLGTVNFKSLDLATLQSESYSTTPLDGNKDSTNQLVDNDVFAVLTNGGNHAKVKIISYGSDLQIKWVTYQG